MEYRDQDNFLDASVFNRVQGMIDNLVQKDTENASLQKVKTRMNQTIEFYKIEKQDFLDGVITYAQAMVAITAVTTRISEHCWAVDDTYKKESKHIIAEIYNIHDILKKTL